MSRRRTDAVRIPPRTPAHSETSSGCSAAINVLTVDVIAVIGPNYVAGAAAFRQAVIVFIAAQLGLSVQALVAVFAGLSIEGTPLAIRI